MNRSHFIKAGLVMIGGVWVPKQKAATIIIRGPRKSGGGLSSGLTHYWDLDETSGNRSDSGSGTAATLTDTNTVTNATGKLSNAASFEYSNSEYLVVNDQSDLRFSGDFTISAWVKMSSTDAKTIISKDNGSSGASREFLLYIASTNTLSCYLFGDLDLVLLQETTNLLSTGTWYFVCARRDGNTLKLRVNGNTDVTTSVSAIGTTGGTSAFAIGQQGFLNFALSSYWDGEIDEVGFWQTRSLSDSEVDQLYNSGGTPPTLP